MYNQEQEHMEIELQKSKAGRKRGLGIILMKKELKKKVMLDANANIVHGPWTRNREETAIMQAHLALNSHI